MVSLSYILSFSLVVLTSAAPLFLLFLATFACIGHLVVSRLILIDAELEASRLLIVIVIAYRVSLNAGQLLRQLVEQRLNVLSRLRGRLEEKQIHSLCVLLALLDADLPALAQVGLVASENDGCFAPNLTN